VGVAFNVSVFFGFSLVASEKERDILEVNQQA